MHRLLRFLDPQTVQGGTGTDLKTIMEGEETAQQTVTETPKPTDVQQTKPDVTPTDVKPTPDVPSKNVVELSPEAIKALADTMRTSPTSSPGQPQSQPQMSDEEIDKILNTVKVAETDLTEIFEGGPKAVTAMQRLLESTVKNAVAVSTLVANQRLAEIDSRYSPLMQAHVTQQRESLRKEFFASNSNLEKYSDIVEVVGEQMQKSGFKGDKKQVFEELAKRTAEFLKKNGIDVSASASAGQQGTPTPAKPKMPQLSTGGQGGGSSTTPGDKTKSENQTLKSLFQS